MYIQWNKSDKNKKYPKAILRESYRENGKIKKRTIANLGNCSIEEIKALELALKNKANLSDIRNLKEVVTTRQGMSMGATWVIYQQARKLGIEEVLGTSESGKLALWQVIARVIDQGSRLSVVRMARDEASDEFLHFSKGFSEDDLYTNLAWLTKNQREIEKKLFKHRHGEGVVNFFLYDVTSSYLEGQENELGNYGYNRDGKKGKRQIVIGLLCDERGIPVATEVFTGNTGDTKTFASQIKKVAEDFGCKEVTFIGDKGMIKSQQIKDLEEKNFRYITTITKPQIEKFIKDNIFQLSLFDKEICEVTHEDCRYILRKNPAREADMKSTRDEKEISLNELIKKQAQYLKDHPKAKEEVALRKVNERIGVLKANGWLTASIEERELKIEIDEDAKEEAGKLDGCYCVKTNLTQEESEAKVIHDRYKDLIWVENAFRSSKTVQLELRPVYTVCDETTRGHVFVVMLAYIILQSLKEAWNDIGLTPEEGIKRLRTLCTVEVKIENQVIHQIPEANDPVEE